MKKSLLTLPFLLLAAALALAACGGGGSSSSGGGDDETAIEEAIEGAATTTNPSKCSEFQTMEFNEYESGESGKAALKGCEKQVEDETSPAESVDVSNISVDGETATAEAAITGSALLDGQSLELEMAKEDGTWKLNKFLKFTNYDGKSFAAGVEKEIESEGELEPAAVKCVSEGVAAFSQEETEKIFLERNETPLIELLKSCE